MNVTRIRNALARRMQRLKALIIPPPERPDYVRATHYFGDGWALNFLQIVDSASLKRDMAQIVEDGFNTVILVIPWRGLQTDHMVPAYDAFYLSQLKRCLAAADKAGLSVIVRLSYAHQILDRQPLSGLTAIQRLLTDPETQAAWLDYLERVHKVCNGYRCFWKAFVSWEEFWHSFWRWQLYTPEHRAQLAEEVGYNRFLDSLGLTNERRLPRPEEPDYNIFHQFMNARIREMYSAARTRIPELGIEIRVDMDRYEDGSGEVSWLESDNFTDIDVTRYTYWAPFMGAENRGELLSSDRALELLRHSLHRMTRGGGHRDHIVDQFNFVDDAPKFHGIHARIEPDQVSQFLEGAVPVMRQESAGYGIWAYRDYRQNVLYNPRFCMGLEGWRLARGSAVPMKNGGVRLANNAVLRQIIPARVAGLQNAVPFDRFDCIARTVGKSTPSGTLEVRLNSGKWFTLTPGAEGELEASIPVPRPVVLEDGIVIELRHSGTALSIDQLFLHHFVFRSGFRDEHNGPGDHHQQVVEFNQALASYSVAATLQAAQQD